MSIKENQELLNRLGSMAAALYGQSWGDIPPHAKEKWRAAVIHAEDAIGPLSEDAPKMDRCAVEAVLAHRQAEQDLANAVLAPVPDPVLVSHTGIFEGDLSGVPTEPKKPAKKPVEPKKTGK